MTTAINGIFNQVQTEELRAFCDCPTKFQTLDFLGVALGSYFAIDGVRRFKDEGEQPWASVSIGLGALMIWIHSRRFVYGSELGTRFEGGEGTL